MEIEEKNRIAESSSTEEFIASLRDRVLQSMVESGFTILDDRNLLVPNNKEFIRNVHRNAVNYIREKRRKFIDKFDDIAINKYIINGNELDIGIIEPHLIKIDNENENNIFNWVKLHWSIPTSAGYGRRLRYLVYDKGNSAVMGIIGLADPVYALKDRDRYIGWSPDTRKTMLKHVMDAFVLGSVPPYSMILGGKLVASLLMSSEISKDFREKYKGKRSLISGEEFDGKLAAITTASALGKSSVYDRIKIPGASEFLHVGWSSGSGEFQFFNGVYDDIFRIAHTNAEHLKNSKWGSGVRNRRTVIRTGLKMLGLPGDLLYHNIRRELFLVPLGKKTMQFLRGESKQVIYYNLNTNEISKYALKRWVIPRSQRRNDYLYFKKESYSLLQTDNLL